MKKVFLILLLGFFYYGNAYAEEKIYCLDLDNFGDDWNLKTKQNEYYFIAYEVVDKNNSKKCNENVPSSIKNHNFIKIDEFFYFENKSKDKGYFSPGDAFTGIPVKDLAKYFIKNNIKIDFEKLVENKKKALNAAEDLSRKKSQEKRSQDLKVKLCIDKLDFSWNTYKLPNMATFEFKSSCDRATYITDLIIYTNDGKEMTRYNPPDGYIRPYGVKTIQFYIGDLNKDLIKTASYLNKMEKPKGTSKSSKSKKPSKGQRLSGTFAGLIVILAIVLVSLFYFVKSTNIENKKSYEKNNLIETKALKNKKVNQSSPNLIEVVWNGQETLSKTFWMYCILTVGIISFVSGLGNAFFGSIIYLIPLAVIIWSNTGLWRCSNIYQNQKLKSGQTYGWATAAKVYVVFNYITTLSQLGFILRGF